MTVGTPYVPTTLSPDFQGIGYCNDTYPNLLSGCASVSIDDQSILCSIYLL